MRIIGLTGCMGMGKSTVAHLFAQEGVPVQKSDSVVHELYAGEAQSDLWKVLPELCTQEGKIDLTRLGDKIVQKPSILDQLEAILHPFVAQKRQEFLRSCEAQRASWAMVEIPLLLEKGLENETDFVLVVSAPQEVWRKRLLQRSNKNLLDILLRRQWTDDQKRCRAHWIIETGGTLAYTQRQVKDFLRAFAPL